MANDILIRIGATAEDLKKELASASNDLSKFGDGAKNIAGKIAVGIGAATAATAYLVKQSFDAIDANAKLASQMGSSIASFEALSRAGDLSGISIDQISKASRELTIKLSEASSGSKAASDAFTRIGLSTAELQKIPIDQQIIKITNALENNVPAAERAAAAADIFGKKNALAMASLDSGTLQTATEEAILFGHAISDIDAKKVEMANDSISAIGYAFEGITKQLAVELSPIIKAVGDQFKQTAKDAGGVGNKVREGVDTAIKAIGVLLDIADGVKRTFEIVANSIISVLATADAAGASLAYNIMKYLDKIPGVDLTESTENMRQEMELMKGVVEQSKIAFDEILMRPMPSDSLKQFVNDARVAAEEAAKEAVKIKETVSTAAGISTDNKKQKEAKADPDIEARAKQLDSLRESLLSETEALKQKLENDQVLLDQAVIDKTISLQEAQNIEAQLVAEHQAKLTEIEKAEQDRRKEQEDAAQKAKFAAITQTIQGLGMLMDTGNKKGFERNKKFALADAAISMYQGIAAGLRLGWPMAIPAVAYAAGTGLQQINSIRSQKFGGGVSSAPMGGGSMSASGLSSSAAQPATSKNIFLSGISPSDFVKSGTLIEALNKELADGGNLNIGFA